MKTLLLSLALALSTFATRAQAETCEKLGPINGVYWQHSIYQGVSTPNGLIWFDIKSPTNYQLTMAGDLNVDGSIMGERVSEIKLETKRRKCTFINPIYPEPNATIIVGRGSNGRLQLKNQNAMDRRAYMELVKIER